MKKKKDRYEEYSGNEEHLLTGREYMDPEGKIVDQGVHTDLIRSPGYYQQMWELQNENGS